MKKIIRIFALVLALAMLAGMVACGNTPAETTPSQGTSATTGSTAGTTATTGGDATTGTTQTTGTSGTSGTTETTKTEEPPSPPEQVYNKLLAEKFGNYLTLRYNPAYCNVKVETKAGVGSSESYTIKVTMKDGYKFKGFSRGNGIANGYKAISTSEEYSVRLSQATTLWLNCAMTYVYHANGGTYKTGGEIYECDADITYYKNPNSLPERGYFKRDGYILVEYNTKADGTGEGTSLGSRPYVGDRAQIDLYCIWAKEAPASDFKYERTADGMRITGYTGNETEILAVPAKIDGVKVYSVGDKALANTKAKTVVIPSGVTELYNEAFAGSAAETLVITDAISKFTNKMGGSPDPDSVIKDCKNLANIRMNAVREPLYPTYIESNMKYDYLLWAKNRKKIVYVAGSSGQFGFVAEDMEKALDDEYVVVNYGSNANISGSFWMEYIEKFMGKDDILLWAPEDGPYLFGETRLSRRVWRSLECNYDVFRYVDMRNYTGFFSSLEAFREENPSTTSKYTYDSFNTAVNNNGDLFNDRSTGPVAGSFTLNQFPRDVKCINLMNEQFDKMRDKGAKVYISFAPMSATVLYDIAKKTDEDIEKHAANVAERYHGTVISDIKDHAIESRYFADSVWHMTEAGAHLRTEILIRDVKAQLAKEGK